MKKFLIIYTLILSISLGNNFVIADEKFEPAHKNAKSGKEYGIKDEYKVRKLENSKLEIEFKKDIFTFVNKDEISKISNLDYSENVSNYSDVGIVRGLAVRAKTITISKSVNNLLYSRYYEEYDSGIWYSGTLNLENIECKDENHYVTTYIGLLNIIISKKRSLFFSFFVV